MFRDKTTWLLCLVAVLVGVGLWVLQRAQHDSPASAMQPIATEAASTPSPFAKLVRYPQQKLVRDFTLQNANGAVFSKADLMGQYSLMFFGFTNCPDICPMTLADMKKTIGLWQRARNDKPPQVVFISVDPERDSLAKLREYTDYFSPDFIAATGAPDTLEDFATSLGVLFMKVPSDDLGVYNVDHSASILVINPDGTVAGLFRPPHDPDTLFADLNQLIAAPAP